MCVQPILELMNWFHFKIRNGIGQTRFRRRTSQHNAGRVERTAAETHCRLRKNGQVNDQDRTGHCVGGETKRGETLIWNHQ